MTLPSKNVDFLLKEKYISGNRLARARLNRVWDVKMTFQGETKMVKVPEDSSILEAAEKVRECAILKKAETRVIVL